jgi:hypothetical protein
MKTLIIKVTHELEVPDNFTLKQLEDEEYALKVGKKFGRPTIMWMNWEKADESEPDFICSGTEDHSLNDKIWNYLSMEDVEYTFVKE